MRFIRNSIAAVLAMGLASVVYALPATTTANHEAAPVATQDQQNPPKQDKHKQKTDTDHPQATQQEHPQKPEKPNKQERKAEKNETKHQQTEPREQNENHQTARNGGKRIPDRDFHAHFGREHSFTVKRVITTTRIVPNQTQFVYSGYTFIFVDPWPDDWSLDDDCYIDSDGDEYFLVDAVHPGVQVALTVVM